MADKEAPVQPAQDMIPPAPVDMRFGWGKVQGPDGPRIVLVIATPTTPGGSMYFLIPSVARKVGEALVELAESTVDGLVVTGPQRPTLIVP